MGLFKVLLVNLLLVVLLVSTYELLDPELHPAQLNHIKLVDFRPLYYIINIVIKTRQISYTYIVLILSNLLLQLIISVANYSPYAIQTCLFIARVPMTHLEIASLPIPRHFQ